MRVIATAILSAILLCALLEACGSKGALYLPPKPGSETAQPLQPSPLQPSPQQPSQQQPNSNKQN